MVHERKEFDLKSEKVLMILQQKDKQLVAMRDRLGEMEALVQELEPLRSLPELNRQLTKELRERWCCERA